MTSTIAGPALQALPLRCGHCGHESEPAPQAICGECLGPLEPVYPTVRSLPSRETIASRPASLWRYREWLPLEGPLVHSLDSGFTPLIDAPRLADWLGVGRAWVKNDAVSHPSLSFKDRVVATAINAATRSPRMRRGLASPRGCSSPMTWSWARSWARRCTSRAWFGSRAPTMT